MSEQAIRKLKKKIILMAMVSFMLVILLMGAFVFCFNVVLTRAEIRRVLTYVAENDGMVPETTPHTIRGTDGFRNPIFHPENDDGFTADDVKNALEALFQLGRGYDTPEFFYTMRYFAVLYDETDAVEDVIVNHIYAVDSDHAVELANEARRRFFRFGSFGDYYYLNTARSAGGQIVVYLDSTNQIFMNNRLLFISLTFLCMGSVITFCIIRGMANRIIRPEIRNAELQKRFLTNASHELKTPLAVIRANTELIEMTGGENEWTQATMRQVDRLQGLIENLVMITRAQEQDAGQERTEMDVAKAVRETAETFATLAKQEGKTLVIDAADGVRLTASEGDIRQLTSLLVDNAIKYCDAGGAVTVTLTHASRRGKGVRLLVANSFAEGENTDYDRFFERFYRADESHNTERGGYGIGLSIAEQIVQNYRGDIKARWSDGVVTFDCLLM